MLTAHRPGTSGILALQRSRHQAPTDRASLQLLHGVCGAGGLEVNGLEDGARLCRRHSSGLCFAALQPGTCRCVRLCNGAATKLRLIEQSCDCSIVRGAGVLEVNGLEDGARLCRRHSGGDCFPQPIQAPACMWFAIATAAIKLRLIELACGCSTVCGAGGHEVRAPRYRRHSDAE